MSETREQDGWRPIETAPRDGTRVLIAWDDEVRAAVWDPKFESVWDEEAGESRHRGGWTDYAVRSFGYEEVVEYHPTHWMPLPKSPALQSMHSSADEGESIADHILALLSGSGTPPGEGETLSPAIRDRIVAAAEALVRRDIDEAYHQLYALVDPEYKATGDPFAALRSAPSGVEEGEPEWFDFECHEEQCRAVYDSEGRKDGTGWCCLLVHGHSGPHRHRFEDRDIVWPADAWEGEEAARLLFEAMGEAEHGPGEAGEWDMLPMREREYYEEVARIFAARLREGGGE